MTLHEQPDLEILDQWYTEHFEELIEKYGGRAVAVVKGKIVAVADTEKEAHRLAKVSYPNIVPFVISVPLEEELLCLL